MLTLQNIIDSIQVRFGGRNDAPAISTYKEAANYASILGVLLFSPSELHLEGTIALTTGSSSVTLTTLTRLLAIHTIWNATISSPLLYIPVDLWQIIVPTSLSEPKFYTRRGNMLLVKAAPSTNHSLQIIHSAYPPVMANSSDPLGFEQHDSFVISVATGLTFAAFEEGETVEIWAKVAEFLKGPLELGMKERGVTFGPQVDKIIRREGK